MNLRRERTALWITAAIAVAAIIFGIVQYRQVQQLKILGEVARQRAFFNLLSHVENMEGNLAKARASSTPAQRSAFLTACWSHSQGAQENISVMGMTTVDLSAMQKFVAQVGDYCMVLSQKLARGDTVTPSEWEVLATCETGVKDFGALAETGASAFRGGGSQAGLLSLRLAARFLRTTMHGSGILEIDSLVQAYPHLHMTAPFQIGRSNQSPCLDRKSHRMRRKDSLDFMNRERTTRMSG